MDTIKTSSEITENNFNKLAQNIEYALDQDIQRALDDQLVRHCAFLDNSFRFFSKKVNDYIADEKRSHYLPDASLLYSFRAMDQYRSTYNTLQESQIRRRLLTLREKE